MSVLSRWKLYRPFASVMNDMMAKVRGFSSCTAAPFKAFPLLSTTTPVTERVRDAGAGGDAGAGDAGAHAIDTNTAQTAIRTIPNLIPT
jgi:hypothetical protein